MIQNKQIQEYKPVSLNGIKLLFFHYFFDVRSAGVNRVIKNNIKGLKLFYPNLNPIFASGGFEKGVFDEYEKRFINLGSWKFFKNIKSCKMKKDLENITSDVKVVSGHNLLRGICPVVTEAFRDFSEISGKVREYRNHDFVLRYPKVYKEIISHFNNFGKMFPKSPEVIQTTLTTSTRRDMEIFFRGNIKLMRNSVVCEDLYPRKDGKDEKLKELLLKKRIFENGMKHVIYAVRADERKNLEEALFITSVLSYISGTPHKLIVTASKEKDYKKPEENEYQRNIEKFADNFNIPYSIGEAYHYVDDKEFNIGNLYRAGDMAITTAFKEGFGYSNVEPWVSGVPVIGRWIREVCEDFERNGMKLKEVFYDSSVLYSKGNPKDRIDYFGEILGDKKIFKQFVKRVNLEERIDYSKKYLEHNARIVKEVYGHDVVAKDLAKLYNLSNYKNIRLV